MNSGILGLFIRRTVSAIAIVAVLGIGYNVYTHRDCLFICEAKATSNDAAPASEVAYRPGAMSLPNFADIAAQHGKRLALLIMRGGQKMFVAIRSE